MSDDGDPARSRDGGGDGDRERTRAGTGRDPDDGTAADAAGEGAAQRADAPLADLRESLAGSATRDDAFDELFDDPSEPVLDGEDAWGRLLAEDADPAAAATVVQSAEDRDVRVVESRLCHTCPYFADPPDVACTHEGTDIREVVDTEHFEVADCPMVVDADDRD